MTDWAGCVEAVEAGYEFMLAYAAQGLEANQGGAHETEARTQLRRMVDALSAVGEQARALAENKDASNVAAYTGLFDALEHDATHALGAVQLVLTRSGLSSQLIDNLNASSHMRALLTDIFLIDEALNRG